MKKLSDDSLLGGIWRRISLGFIGEEVHWTRNLEGDVVDPWGSHDTEHAPKGLDLLGVLEEFIGNCSRFAVASLLGGGSEQRRVLDLELLN